MSEIDCILTRELEVSKEKFELVFNLCPAAMALRRLSDLTYVEVNQAWLNYTGFQRGEIVGKTATELAIGDNFLAWQSKYEGQLSGKAEVQFGTKSGEVRTGIWTFNIIEVDKEKYVLTSIIDITDNKKLEAEMHKLDRLNIIGEMAAGVAHEIRNPLTVIKGYLQHLYHRGDYNMQGILTIITEHLARDIVLTISDTGSGIPFDLQQRVFDPFFTTKDNGTGLGLSICASIVQRHDGKLQMCSQEGKGTIFKVRFPGAF